MPASGGRPEAIANAIASGSATSPTVTPAVTSAAKIFQEYPRSAERSFGPGFSRRAVMPAGAAGGGAAGALGSCARAGAGAGAVAVAGAGVGVGAETETGPEAVAGAETGGATGMGGAPGSLRRSEVSEVMAALG